MPVLVDPAVFRVVRMAAMVPLALDLAVPEVAVAAVPSVEPAAMAAATAMVLREALGGPPRGNAALTEQAALTAEAEAEAAREAQTLLQ
jgi:hypothetical protein